jgi:dimethylargininase
VIIALTRNVSLSINQCELTHLERSLIDVERAQAQHERYEEALTLIGCAIERLPPCPDLPDAVFVEDTAVVVDEIAVIANPGAPSRRPETVTVQEALACHRQLAQIEPPGTLDGGDVLRAGRRLWVGLSGRSNRAGVDQLASALRPFGYQVAGIELTSCLHLKTAVCQVAPDTVLLNRRWVDPSHFAGLEIIDVDETEPFAANALLVGEKLIHAASHVRTREMLEKRGFGVVPVDVSELAKAEAGVTCCSIIFRA